jgi:hypothetical protein
MAVAFIALAVALAGTAVAVTRGPGKKVTTKDLDVVQHAVEHGIVQTSDTEYTLGEGPEISGKARAGDLLRVSANATLYREAGSGDCRAYLDIEGAGVAEMGFPLQFAELGAAGPPVTLWLTDDAIGAFSPQDAIERTLPIVQNGTYAIEMIYASSNASTDCEFYQRNLWVEHVR